MIKKVILIIILTVEIITNIMMKKNKMLSIKIMNNIQIIITVKKKYRNISNSDNNERRIKVTRPVMQ